MFYDTVFKRNTANSCKLHTNRKQFISLAASYIPQAPPKEIGKRAWLGHTCKIPIIMCYVRSLYLE